MVSIKKRVFLYLMMFSIMVSCCVTGISASAEGEGVFIFANADLVDNSCIVTVSIESGTDISIVGIGLTLIFEKDCFKYVESSCDDYFKDAEINNSQYSDSVNFIWESSSKKEINGSVTVFTAKFTVSDTAYEGDHWFYINCNEIYNLNDSGYLEDIDYQISGSSVWIGEKLEIDCDATDMVEKTTMQLSANKNVSRWISFNSEVLSVDENGLATAKKPGKATVVATGGLYDGETAIININVSERRLFFLNVTRPLTKKVYYVGESLDYAGLQLKADYSNYEVETITSGFTSDYDFSQIGQKAIRIYYDGIFVYSDVYVVKQFDANGDSQVNVKDLIRIKKALAGQTQMTLQQIYSVNYGASDTVNTADMVAVLKHLIEE